MSEAEDLLDSEVFVDISDTEKHQFWQEAIAMQQSSGLNIRQFCRQEGLKEALFYGWRKKLSNPADKDTVISISKTKKEPFVEIDLPKTSAGHLMLEITGIGILKIQSGFDISALKQFLKVIKELDRC